ncbi:peptidoglycan DD-metalloendopeptidase family protein [Asticcacaulis solisilvae]|uniref:peptidoglycan DD-metalloendopeptidase family protein n=1 Tax=Asticcacaulis solisilvae TaxID=1217274 RepID=UPI003FD72E6C
MTSDDRRNRLKGVIRLCAMGALGVGMLMLQACSTAMPEPKYPIYMQDKPAEATQTPAQAGDDKPTVPAITAQGSKGGISSSDLPPPPPPPPPPSDTASSSSSSSSQTSAPVKDTRAAFVYILQAHDTLYGVSRRFGVPVKVLYDLNGLEPNSGLRIGQKILLPANAVDKGSEEHAGGPTMVRLQAALAKPSAPAPAPASTPAKPVVAARPATPAPKEAATKDVPAPAATKPAVTPPSKPVAVTQPPAPNGFPSNAQLAQMGKGLFVWPVRGKILVPFGQLAPNVRNDGINIAADEGTDVHAASDGVVVYEGDQVKELGNTVYIKHPNGWYTGYSHLSSMTVKNNQKITKGEVIGHVGQSGVIDRPQLHFEVRYTPSTDIARPIDPTLVLP